MGLVAQVSDVRNHLGTHTVEETQTFAANGHCLRSFASALRIAQLCGHSAQQIGVQTTAQAFVCGDHNEAHGLAVGVLHVSMHILRVGLAEIARDGANFLCVRTRRAHALLRFAHFGDRNHLHRFGDLLGVFHRFDLGA